jgi:hypothetical protein
MYRQNVPDGKRASAENSGSPYKQLPRCASISSSFAYSNVEELSFRSVATADGGFSRFAMDEEALSKRDSTEGADLGCLVFCDLVSRCGS